MALKLAAGQSAGRAGLVDLVAAFRQCRPFCADGGVDHLARKAPSAASQGALSRQQGAAPQATAEWTEVQDPNSGGIYYWNKATDETTAVGEPRPGPEGRVQAPPQGSVAGSLGQLVAMGAGVGIVFGLMGKMLGG